MFRSAADNVRRVDTDGVITDRRPLAVREQTNHNANQIVLLIISVSTLFLKEACYV